MPDDVDIRLEFDQSPFVTNSIRGLVTEGLLGAALTGLMVLIFLRDWRSALIVVMNIPFALLGAVVLLWATGQSINIMTLGGLALAVGVLVDEATVEIENIHTQMLPGVSRARAVVEACSRTAMARLLSMFCILAVFVPSFFMVGVGRQLFVPLSLAVAFSMIASYLLSSSLVPVFSTWLMKAGHRRSEGGLAAICLRALSRGNFAIPMAAGRRSISRRSIGAGVGVVAAHGNRAFSGIEISADPHSPAERRRGRAWKKRSGMVLRALDVIRRTIGADNIEITSDFVGVVPSSYPVDLIHLFTSGPQEAIIQVQLKPDAPAGEALREKLRASFAKELPGVQVSFEAADIVTQVHELRFADTD